MLYFYGSIGNRLSVSEKHQFARQSVRKMIGNAMIAGALAIVYLAWKLKLLANNSGIGRKAECVSHDDAPLRDAVRLCVGGKGDGRARLASCVWH
jgi:hypothetical protein